MVNYNHTTLSDLRSNITTILDDEGVFWPATEIDKFIKESLLTFGALSGFWKEEITFPTINGQRIYDIFDTSLVPTFTYQDILDWINIDLVESLSIGSPISDYLSVDEIIKLIEARYNSFQLLTNLIITQDELDVEAENKKVILSNDTLDIVRLVFAYENDGTNYETILQRVDEQELSYFQNESNTEENIPEFFSTLYDSPNTINLYPIPNVSGTLKILSINGRDTTIDLDLNTPINLPNNLVPYLKFGIEADIFSKDGLLNDPARSAYCEKRWQEGITIGKNYTSILIAKANGIIIDTDSLNKLDNYITPTITSDPPMILGLAGFNIFEVDTIPNADINSINLIVNKDATIPVLDGDFIDVEKSYIEIIGNYCIHLAQMKCGAADLANTNNYMEEFIKLALQHNIRLQKRGVTFESLVRKTKLEEKQKPRIIETVTT